MTCAIPTHWPSDPEAPDCSEGVSRGGRYEPCDKPAAGLRVEPEDGKPYPVCKRHLRPPYPPETRMSGGDE